MSDEQITIPLETAQILFDALSTSLDFGSGFLDTDDVNALRDLAILIGVDPIQGTPVTFVKDYPHAFKAMDDQREIDRIFGEKLVVDRWSDGTPKGWEWKPRELGFVPCRAGAYPYCQKPENDPIHGAADAAT